MDRPHPSTGARRLATALLLAVAVPVAAGEVYGTVSASGRAQPGKTVELVCPSLTPPTTARTDSYGGYRMRGPDREERCTITFEGAGNSVDVYASAGRTRINLEVVGGHLIRK